MKEDARKKETKKRKETIKDMVDRWPRLLQVCNEVVVAPRMTLFIYFAIYMFQLWWMHDMVQNLVDDGQCCICVYIFCYIFMSGMLIYVIEIHVCLKCWYVCNACMPRTKHF
jgi:hypothetical protein